MSVVDGGPTAALIGAEDEPFPITLVVAAICLAWYITVASVCLLGQVQLFRYYSKPPARANLTTAPDITIIRPVKGPETYLYACLAATFQQAYPKDKVHVRLCISSRDDPSLPVLEQLLLEFPEYDAKILVEDEDPALRSGPSALGPNPKIRNMSHAYRQARSLGDIVWIIDCNVWVDKHTLERKVNLSKDFKYVHLTPIIVDTDSTSHGAFGGRIDECFLSTYHAKFYAAINTVLVAPAVVGKSTMFRISHLDSITDGQGLDYFSENICEDQLTGTLLWKRKVPEELAGKKLAKHALCFGNLAIQPVSGMKLREYWDRRVRWLRVRKFTVMLATGVEPATESFTCSLFGAYALTTLPSSPIPHTWTAFLIFWLFSVGIWCANDRRIYLLLQSNASVHVDDNTPWFAQPPRNGFRRSFGQWLCMWLAREALALPIWLTAICWGSEVEWRGRKFWVGRDMKVHEVEDSSGRDAPGDQNGHIGEKVKGS